MGEYAKLCGKLGPGIERDGYRVETVCIDDDTHVGHHNYVARVDKDTVASLRREVAELRAALAALGGMDAP